jgi:hypothetical protein
VTPADAGARDALSARRIPLTTLGLRLLLFAIGLYVTATAVRVYARRYDIFLRDYFLAARSEAAPTAGPTHVFFLFVDHFEPGGSLARTKEWGARYRDLAWRHLDSSGRPVQHTWFFPGDQVDDAILGSLRELTTDGLGEVELHYHHDRDTAATLAPRLQKAISAFQKFGFLETVSGKTAFAFVHGNGGLDNADGTYCGVDDELRLLRDLGCFADFTFPALYHKAQPPFVNTIYAAREDGSPKSYRFRLPLTDLANGAADLMIFEGPLVLAPSWSLRRLFIDVDDGNVHPAVPTDATRVQRWVNARVHVAGRPDWVFVKVFAHGISSPADADEVLGDHFDRALTELERRYNDGEQYVLHYVTAREAYNLAMAAATGAKGDPAKYLDHGIPPYRATAPRSGRRQHS